MRFVIIAAVLLIASCASDPPKLSCDEMIKAELSEGAAKSQAIRDGLACRQQYGQQ